jgi:hypothetical protein
VAQVVEHLPRYCETLSSNPSTTKKKSTLVLVLKKYKEYTGFGNKIVLSYAFSFVWSSRNMLSGMIVVACLDMRISF